MNHKDIIIQLTKKELKLRYKNHALGYLWSVANPMAFAAIYFIVFQVLMKVQIKNYALVLVCGLFPWQWLANTIGVSPSIFLGNASLIKKVIFPRQLLVLVVVIQDMLHFIFALPVILALMIYYHIYPSLNWLILFPTILIIQLTLVYSLSLLIGSINLFFRDLEKLVGIFMTFLFYSTPVVYQVEMIPERFRSLIYLNPFATIIISWKNLFLESSYDIKYLLSSAAWSALAFGLSSLIFKKLSWRFAEVL